MAAQNANAFWTDAQEQYVLDNVAASNEDLAKGLGRSPWAIQWKRAHLATKLHTSRPDMSLAECSDLTCANHAQTAEILASRQAKESSFSSFLTKRKASERSGCEPRPQAAGGTGGKPELAAAASDEDRRILAVCEAITAEEGHLSALFHDESMLPLIVRHYPGFQAFALGVRGI